MNTMTVQDPNLQPEDGELPQDPSDAIEASGIDALVSDLNGTNDAEGTDSEADALLLAGYQAANGDEEAAAETIEAASKEPATTEGPGEQQPPQPTLEERIAAAERAAQAANGHIGSLMQRLQQQARPRQLSKDHLTRIREEFGDEYAEALAADLNAAGVGGAGLSAAEIQAQIQQQVAQERETLKREMHKDRVLEVHPDADDFFARPNPETGERVAGPQHAAFVQWIGTLPAKRQQEIANSWDARVMSGALTEFKAARNRAAQAASRQQSRVNRGVVPSGSGASGGVVPQEDPLMQGWKNVKGQQAGGGPRG